MTLKSCKKSLHRYSAVLLTCPECTKLRNRASYKKRYKLNPTRFADHNSKFYVANPSARQGLHLRRRYWPYLSWRDALNRYNRLLLRQQGCCAICNVFKPLNVDHDHKTGQVRGLLCTPCNTGLGAFKDSITFLRKAAAYLEVIPDEVEVTLGDQRVAGPSPAPKPIPPQPPNPRQPAPPSPAAAPPTESSIPHHVNEVQSLLRMSDNDLVDKLFPLPKGTEG